MAGRGGVAVVQPTPCSDCAIRGFREKRKGPPRGTKADTFPERLGVKVQDIMCLWPTAHGSCVLDLMTLKEGVLGEVKVIAHSCAW